MKVSRNIRQSHSVEVINGWDFTKSQKVYSVNSDNIYTAMVYFDGKAADGWKILRYGRLGVRTIGGAPEKYDTPNNPLVTLVSGNGGDIKSIQQKNSLFILEISNK